MHAAHSETVLDTGQFRTLLDACRLQVERSSALLRQAQALLTELHEVRRGRWIDVALRAERPAAVGSQDEVHCSMWGCTRAGEFRPCFVVERGIRRILVSDMPVRVCSEHRADLDALLRRPDVLDRLRGQLCARGREEPRAVHVLFEAVN